MLVYKSRIGEEKETRLVEELAEVRGYTLNQLKSKSLVKVLELRSADALRYATNRGPRR